MLFPSTDKFHQERACGLNDVACLSVNDFDSCFFKSGAGGGFKGAAEQNSRIQLSEKCDMRGVAGGGGNLAEPVDAPLAAGNVVSVEPGLYHPSWGGIRLEDIVAVTKDGCHNFNTMEKELELD